MSAANRPVPEIIAVVNPISGGGAASWHWSAVAAELSRLGAAVHSVVESRSGEHAAEVAAKSARAGMLTVAVGGDGHVRSVAAGVLAVPGAALGIAAAGRGNDLARHLRLPADPAAAAGVLAAGFRRPIDVLDVALPDGASSIAVGNVYAGIDSVATELINELRWMGRLGYRVGPVLAGVRWRPVRVSLTVDDERRDVSAHMVVIANSGDYGHGMRMVPSASVDSGKIDVLVVRGDLSKYRLAGLMSQAKTGAHVDRPEIEVLTGTSVTLSADRGVPVHADGDYIGELPVSVRLRSRVLPVVVPERWPFVDGSGRGGGQPRPHRYTLLL